MNFNKLVHNILQETLRGVDVSKIPLLDGTRELYHTRCDWSLVTPICRDDDLKRFDSHYSNDDKSTVLYSGSDGFKALQVYKENLNVLGKGYFARLAPEAIREALPLTKLYGYFMIVYYDNGGASSLIFTVEVDQERYRTGGLTDAAKDSIDGVDISGW